jgi:hypothetical protein
VLYATDYTSIQSAINAAGTSNSVIIPATYTGTDSYVNNNNIQVLDYRNNQLGVWSVISSAWNVDKYPYGNDLVLRASGSADTYIEKLVVAATTTAPLVVGVNTNVLISSVTLGSAARGAVKTGTSTMFSAFGGLLVGRDTPNEEYISYSNVTIIDATHITFTCAKTHTGTTDLEQVGSTLLTSPDLYIIPSAVKASQTTGFNPQLRVKDLHGTPFLYLPSDIQSPFPYALAQWRAVQGGANGTNLDLIFQHAGTASSFIYRDPNLNVLLQLNPTGQLSVNSGFSSGAGAMNLTGSVAEVQIGRNQAGAAITSTVDCHVVWQGGTDPLNPSATAGSLLLAARNIANCSINFATQNTVRASIAPTGLNVVNGFGCNAKPAQGSVAVNAASTDLASAIALVNQLRAALIANGICI